MYPGVNVSDDPFDWTTNYRCPDVAVFLPGNPAEERETHFLGGPDFLVEIVSKHARSREKFGFYAKTGVRELLFVDRKPWKLELYRRDGDGWAPPETSEPSEPAPLASEVLGRSFRLVPGPADSSIEIVRAADGATWTA